MMHNKGERWKGYGVDVGRRLQAIAGGGRNKPRRRSRRGRHRSSWRVVRHDPIKRHESYPYRRLCADDRAWSHRHYRRTARSPAAGAALIPAHPIPNRSTESAGAMNILPPRSLYVRSRRRSTNIGARGDRVCGEFKSGGILLPETLDRKSGADGDRHHRDEPTGDQPGERGSAQPVKSS